jgi:hypothetical protein
LVSLAVSSSYSKNGKYFVMGTDIRMVLEWVAFLLYTSEVLGLNFSPVCGCCDGRFCSRVLAGKCKGSMSFSARTAFFCFLTSSLLSMSFSTVPSLLLVVSLTKPQINKVCCMLCFSCMILAMTLAKPSRPW